MTHTEHTTSGSNKEKEQGGVKPSLEIEKLNMAILFPSISLSTRLT